jgi:hypothetical protein
MILFSLHVARVSAQGAFFLVVVNGIRTGHNFWADITFLQTFVLAADALLHSSEPASLRERGCLDALLQSAG